MSNIISRRDYLVRQMLKEFPTKTVEQVSNAVWELEMEDPKTDYDEKVFYDTGKPVKKKSFTKNVARHTRNTSEKPRPVKRKPKVDNG